jgi:hypothetical protein
MKCFCVEKEVQDMDWLSIFDIWNDNKHWRLVELDTNNKHWCLKFLPCLVGLLDFNETLLHIFLNWCFKNHWLSFHILHVQYTCREKWRVMNLIAFQHERHKSWRPSLMKVDGSVFRIWRFEAFLRLSIWNILQKVVT